MGRFAFSLTVLCFLFAFTYARTPFDLPENDVSDRDLSSSLPESDTKATLLLPSEKTESESTTFVELEPETAETKPLDIDTEVKEAVGTTEDLPVSDTKTVDADRLNRPLTIVRFRPINRHFPSKRPYPFRFPLRGCHHGIKPMMKHRFHGREMSYGDDMILAGESKDFDPEMFGGGMRQIPKRWGRFHHHHHHDEGMPRFPFSKHHDMFAKHSFRRPFRREEEEFRRPFRREEEEEKEKEHEDREEGGFMKHFRKLLNPFEF